ncbi:MAG TPA: hypothetical protein DCL33_02420, partial [Pseudoalteromonas sp.]|nr:hypothetical protein [Pseudoalteromonas sp.]
MSQLPPRGHYTWRTWFTFLVPSLIGVFLFMTPIPTADGMTIPIALMAKGVQALMSGSAQAIITLIICITGVMSVITKVFKPAAICQSPLLKHLFDVSVVWLVVRLFGMAFVLMTHLGLGSEAITSANTGALVLNDLLPVLFSVFILAGLLLPLLINFGLLELAGTMLTKVMRPVFGVPGRSAVDCTASWLGDGSVGILMTARQYDQKHYTQREAAIIGTTFSAVSITFSLVVLGQVKLEHLFAPFYATVCLAGVVAAIIVPRLPPLRFKKDLLIDGSEPNRDAEAIPTGKSLVGHSLDVALAKANNSSGFKGTLKEGVHNA